MVRQAGLVRTVRGFPLGLAYLRGSLHATVLLTREESGGDGMTARCVTGSSRPMVLKP